VTSSDAFTGENFRRGGYLPHAERYERAEEFIAAARELWDSWPAGAIRAADGQFLADPDAGTFAHHGKHFDIAGRFTVPRSPQGHPVVFQAGDSSDGRELAARSADAVFSRHSDAEAGRAFYRDVKGRLARYGRDERDLLILPAATFVLGDTDADALERAAEVRRQQVSPQTAILLLEQVWNRDLSGYDPDGPLPAVDPLVEESSIVQGRARQVRDPFAEANRYRAVAEAKGLSLREAVIELTGRQTFVGSPQTVADTIAAAVATEVSDGFILVPHITPDGLAPFVDDVVPLLQERGVLRGDYTPGATLRDHLGLAPARSAAEWAVGASRPPARPRVGDLHARETA
jgi:FMN-dependent oxidoreductase (nitrilotriacetate monooxygenase family)